MDKVTWPEFVQRIRTWRQTHQGCGNDGKVLHGVVVFAAQIFTEGPNEFHTDSTARAWNTSCIVERPDYILTADWIARKRPEATWQVLYCYFN